MHQPTRSRRGVALAVATVSVAASLLVAPAAANAAESGPNAEIDAYTQLIFEDNGRYTFIPEAPITSGPDTWDYQPASSRADARSRAPYLRMHRWADGTYSFSTDAGQCLVRGIRSPSLQFGVLWMHKACTNTGADSWRLNDDRTLTNVQAGRAVGQTYSWAVPYTPKYTQHAHVFSGTPALLSADVALGSE